MPLPTFHLSAFPLSGVCLGVLLGAVLLLTASPVRAVDPWVDTGFDQITSTPDADLVVVRE
jgi:hypothetical protein